ncbi:MAG: efflux RND transporter permease subunit, partial [Bacteroidota bacterium]
MNLPSFSIKNYQFTITLFVFFLVMGINAYISMPRMEDPIVDFPSFNVVAVYPGASPEDVESQVVDPIEEALNELDDVEDLTSEIQDGVGITRVEFEFGVDSDEKFDEVRSKVAEIRDDLPGNLYDLDITKNSTTTVSIYQLALVSNSASYETLNNEAERVKKTIEKVSGVRKVEILDCPEQELRIALDPIKMKEMNVSVDDVERAIQSNNANIPGGALKVSSKLF